MSGNSGLPESVPYDFLTMLHEPGIPPHELQLKKSAVCTLMRNLSVEDGLVKNARVVVQELFEKVVRVELLQNTGGAGKSYLLPRIIFEFQPQFCTWTVQRRQFPLRLGYATTFNSCQGLTLDRAVLDLRIPPFSHGQLYTSVSRVRHRSCIRTYFAADNNSLSTRNIVFKNLLLQ